ERARSAAPGLSGCRRKRRAGSLGVPTLGEVDEQRADLGLPIDGKQHGEHEAGVESERGTERRKPAGRHRCSSSQRSTAAPSAYRTARATTAPSWLTGPPKRQRGPRPVAATTTASVDVPLASRPSSQRTPAAVSASVFTSVAVMTALTSAAGSATASTTTIVLIVAGDHATARSSPAATRFDSPTVTTARARIPSAAASANRAFSVHAEVRRPTHGAGTRRRSAKAASLASVSSRRRLFGTCRFTTARAEVRPPPTTAEETTASGSAAVTTTASRSTVTSTPSIIASPADQYRACSPASTLMPRLRKPKTSKIRASVALFTRNVKSSAGNPLRFSVMR